MYIFASSLHKRSFSMLLFCFLSISQLPAQTVLQKLIGTTSGVSSWQYGPIYRNQNNTGTLNYSRHAYIYTAAELNIPPGSKIIALEWLKKDTGRVLGNNTFNIWLSNTTVSSYPTSMTWNDLMTGASQVFGSTTYSILSGANTYMSATFNQPSPNDSFAYSGGNLQILVDWAKLGYATGQVPFYYAAASGKALGLASPSALTGSSLLLSSTYGNNRPTIRITYVTVPTCSGTPAPGNALSTQTNVCQGDAFTLSLQNNTPGTLVSYQWQSASDNAFTSNLTTIGTGSTITTSQSTTKYYRCLVTCGAGTSSTGISAPVLVQMKPPYECYCPSTAVSTSDEDIVKFVLGSFRNCSDCSTNAPGPGSSAAAYSNFQPIGSIIVERNTIIPFSIEVGNCTPSNYSNRSAIFIDFNQNGSFADAGEQVYSSPISYSGAHTESGTIMIPFNASIGTTGLRVITVEQNIGITNPCLVYNWGETEDYLVDITSTTGCSGPPSPGSTTVDLIGSCAPISGTYSICKGNAVTLSLTNSLPSIGITYQWFNGLGIIPGATGKTYSTPPILSSQTYYCKVTCTNGTSVNQTNSTPLTINLQSFLNCYCSSGAMNASDMDIFEFSLNYSSNASSCTSVAPGVGSILNLYSNFTTLGNLTSVVPGTTVPFSISLDDCDIPAAPYYSGGCAIWIDFNHNSSFSDPGEQVFVEQNALTGPRIVSGNITIPCDALTGQTRLRVSAIEGASGAGLLPCLSYGFGETEDYLIHLSNPTTPCTLPIPAPGNTISSISQICDSAVATLSLQNACLLMNYSFQWYKNNVAIPGATNNIYTSPFLKATSTFYCRVSCGASFVNSTAITLNRVLITTSLSASSPTYCSTGGTAVTLTASGASTYSYSPTASLSASSGSTVSATPTSTTTYTVTGTGATGCTKTSTTTIQVVSCTTAFQVKLYIQGYYNANGLMFPVMMNEGVGSNANLVDTLLVELHSTTSPFNTVFTTQPLLAINGTFTFNLPSLTNSYYLVIKHRNSLETWSAIPVNASMGGYDFTTNASKAFGNNMIAVDNGIWAMFNGELAIDGNFDLVDLGILENDVNNFLFGYKQSDVNGDGNVDLIDLPVVENNVNNFIYLIRP